MLCLECRNIAPRGCALCDDCFRRVMRDLRRLMREENFSWTWEETWEWID